MFGGLFGKRTKSTPQDKELKKLPKAISNSIFNVVGSHSIPAMPAAAYKAFRLSIDPNAEIRDFIEIIQTDEALSARVLKIANSVFYDRGKQSTTIEEAVLVIGLNELRGLLNANTLCDIFPCKHPARAQLWANDIATAMSAKILARRLQPHKEALAFLGGLMHDIGKLLLLQRNTQEYCAVIKRVESEAMDFCQAEEQSFPFDHTEVGQLIGERWNFTSDLLDIIRNHHQPWPEGAPSEAKFGLPFLIKAADLIVHALGLGHPKTFTKFRIQAENQLPEIWARLHIPGGEEKQFLAEIRKSFELEYDLYTGNMTA